MFKNVVKFLNSARKGVKKMRKAIVILMVLGIFGLYAGVAYAALTDPVNITATVGAGTSSVDIIETSIGFGTVAPTQTDHRFEALVPMTADYFPAGFPWAVRIYTDNAPFTDPANVAAAKAGLKGVDGTSYITLKVWNGNYGPAVKPDPEGAYFWAGYDFNGDGDKLDTVTNGSISEVALGFDVNGDGDALDTGLGTVAVPITEAQLAGWLRIPEDNEHIATDKFTWRRLVWHDSDVTGGDGRMTSPFRSYLAIDAAGAKAQAYSCSSTNTPANPLTIQILNY